MYAASASQNFGLVAASSTHAAPDLISTPARGLLITAGSSVDNIGVPADELAGLIFRNLSEVSLPHLGGTKTRRICEAGAWAVAEEGIIEEEDLPFFEPAAGDPDALGRRALSAGGREWDLLTKVGVYVVEDIQDSEAAESLGLEPRNVAIVIEAGSGDLGRLTLSTHRERILSRIRAGVDFDAEDDLPAAPLDSEEAVDLLAATHTGANFSDARAALTLYALRRALADIVDDLHLTASWKVGGFADQSGSMVHRLGLAGVGDVEVLVCGSSLATGTGAMLGSAPPFEVAEVEGAWPWEEAGLLGRVATLNELENRG